MKRYLSALLTSFALVAVGLVGLPAPAVAIEAPVVEESSVAAEAVAAAGTFTRYTANRHYTAGSDVVIGFKTNYYQATSYQRINWMQLCVTAGKDNFNISPTVYDIDLYVKGPTGVIERSLLNRSTGSGWCYTWYPNEIVNSLNASTRFEYSLNLVLQGDPAGVKIHLL